MLNIVDRTDNKGNTKRKGLMILLVFGMLMEITSGALLAWVAPDAVPTIARERVKSTLWEDGSYQVSLGNFSVSGCAPVHFWNDELVLGWCLDGGDSPIGYFDRDSFVWTIGIDSPWEDFFDSPWDSIAYKIIDAYKYFRDL